MFRMEVCEMPDRINVRVEGRFVGDFAEHARLLIAKSEAPSGFVVDSSEVSHIDGVGEQVLIYFKEIGVRFTVDCLYPRDICERLQLPMHGESSVTFRHRPGATGGAFALRHYNNQQRSTRCWERCAGDLPMCHQKLMGRHRPRKGVPGIASDQA